MIVSVSFDWHPEEDLLYIDYITESSQVQECYRIDLLDRKYMFWDMDDLVRTEEVFQSLSDWSSGEKVNSAITVRTQLFESGWTLHMEVNSE